MHAVGRGALTLILLSRYRWDKGKKASNVLPNGEKIVHLTVGGRTSAVVPSRQKKTAAVAGDMDSEDLDGAAPKPQKGRKRKPTVEDEDEPAEAPGKIGGKRVRKKAETNGAKPETDEPQVNGGADADMKPQTKRAKSSKSTPKRAAAETTPSSRRSSRNKAN